MARIKRTTSPARIEAFDAIAGAIEEAVHKTLKASRRRLVGRNGVVTKVVRAGLKSRLLRTFKHAVERVTSELMGKHGRRARRKSRSGGQANRV